MPIITYILPNGDERAIEVPNGQSVMDGSVRNNLPGIVAECGGSCSCATCHVFVRGLATGTFDEPTGEEADLLEFIDGVEPESRLACQLIISEAAEGIRVTVPGGN